VKVITLSPKALQEDAYRLADDIRTSHSQIDMIIGIATGGAYISRHIHDRFTMYGWQGCYREISLSRSSTQTKERIGISRLFTLLPYPVLDLLRRIEASYHALKKPAKAPVSSQHPLHLPEKTEEEIRKAEKVLIIDDAVDTGATLLRLVHTIKHINPEVKITTAVLTVTQKTPYIIPDYTRYRDTLLRCPWAMDYKGAHV
jgi:hypoxanthine phosphoribosyltransferase